MRIRNLAEHSVELAFTLIELLVLIVLIGFLAGMLIPAATPVILNSKKNIAQSEEANLVAAINQYYAEYSHLPASTNAVAAAGPNDFTFGTVSNTPAGSGQLSPITIDTSGENAYQNYNSQVIAILRDDNS